MSNPRIHDDLLKQLEALAPDQQHRVAEFIRCLAAQPPRGVPGTDLLKFAGTLPPDQADELRQAVDDACGRVDADGW